MPDTFLTDGLKGQIEWIVGRYHVSLTDAEVRADWDRRIKRNNRKKTMHKLTPEQAEEIITFAIACHHKNRDLYRRVMTGDFVPDFGDTH